MFTDYNLLVVFSLLSLPVSCFWHVSHMLSLGRAKAYILGPRRALISVSCVISVDVSNCIINRNILWSLFVFVCICLIKHRNDPQTRDFHPVWSTVVLKSSSQGIHLYSKTEAKLNGSDSFHLACLNPISPVFGFYSLLIVLLPQQAHGFPLRV